MTTSPPPPRVYCLLATEAPVALVFRRGPNPWCHLLKWHLDTGVLEQGVWVKKHVYPERCDLSPDGCLMTFYLSGTIKGAYGVAVGVSRVPWLYPLMSWEEPGTWTGNGYSFPTAQPMYGWQGDESIRVGAEEIRLVTNFGGSFINERRRGWVEAPECEPQASDDHWDQRRLLILQKPSPFHNTMLRMMGRSYENRMMSPNPPLYERSTRSGEWEALPEAAWADWDARGRLLVATKAGELCAFELQDDRLREVERHDLRNMTPNPQPAPTHAQL